MGKVILNSLMIMMKMLMKDKEKKIVLDQENAEEEF